MEENLRAFLAWLRLDRGLSENTIKNYLSDLIQLGKIAQKNLIDFKESDVRHCLQQFQKEKLRNSCIQRKLSSLRTYFKFLKLEHPNLNLANPLANIPGPARERTLPKVLTQEEVNCLIDSIDTNNPTGIRDRAMLELFYATGMRVSELAHSRRQDVMLAEQTIRIRGKGSKERIVPFGNSALHWLQRYLEEVYSNWNVGYAEESLFICKGKSQRQAARALSRQEIWALIRDLGKKAGIKKKIFPHMLRHSCATHLLHEGMNLRHLQSLLGHSDVSTTQIYTHVDEQKLMEAHKKFHPRK